MDYPKSLLPFVTNFSNRNWNHFHVWFITIIFMEITNWGNNTSLLAPDNSGKLGTRIWVISMETPHRNNLAAEWSNEYPLALIHSVCSKLRYEILLLWLVASSWYRTSNCQPSSPCGNSKVKYSKGRFASLICSNSPTRWCKLVSFGSHNIVEVKWQPPRYTWAINSQGLPIELWKLLDFL